MTSRLSIITYILLSMFSVGTAQETAPANDWKPSSINQKGKEYPQVNSERRARFRVVAPEAQSVSISLGKVALTKGEDGVWTGITAPLDEGFHYYSLKIDGAEVPDPNSLYFFGAMRWGSGIEVPAADQDFYALKNVPHGQLRQVLFYSKTTDSHCKAFVYTPPGYEQNTETRYPVLYLQHGWGEDENGWGAQGHANLIMDNLLADGKAKPFLIVMTYGMTNDAQLGGPRGGAGGRPAFNFDKFKGVLLDDLVPYVDSHFRTLADQPNRAMAGLSMGGMQTRTIAPANLDKFSAIGLFSGGSIGAESISNMDEFKQKVKLVFVGYGSKELGGDRGGRGGDPKAATEGLKTAGINAHFYASQDTAHEWQSWRRCLYQMAPLLFKEKLSESLSGTWKADFDTQRGLQKYAFTFKQDGTRVIANAKVELDGQMREVEFKEVEFTDNTLTFVEVLNAQGREIRITYTGKVSGDEIKFHRAVGEFGASDSVAKRDVSRNAAPVIPASEIGASLKSPVDTEKGSQKPDPKFLVFLCFGQSNMEGGAKMEEMDRVADKRFQVMADFDNPTREWKKGNWYDAVPPLTRRIRGLTLVDYFGKTMVANLPEGYRVGVIKVAVPGAKIELFDKDKYQEYLSTAEDWKKNMAKEYGGSPYDYLVELAKIAQKDGVIKGILLHQGESNTNDQEWPNKVKKIYGDLMHDLQLAPTEVTLLAGEVVHADQKGATASVNEIIKRLPETLSNSFVVSSAGIPCNPDRLHFTSPGLRELGRRYAVKMLDVMGYKATELKVSYLEPAATQQPVTPPSLPIADTRLPDQSKPPVALKDVFKDDFRVGVAVNRSMTMGQASRRTEENVARDIAQVKQQFNHVVAENDTKWQMIHPRSGADGFDFAPTDALVQFAQSNNMEIAGHTLVWHSQTPNWVFEGTQKPAVNADSTDPKGNELTVSPPRAQEANGANGANAPGAAGGARPGRGPGGPGVGGFGGNRGFDLNGPRASREELLERMREHIHAVVGRYKGKVKVWDVVNEAISDSGPDDLRRSPWSVIIGPDFIAKAFEYAHEADPKAILRYNDYGLENPEKRRKLIKLIKKLQEQNVPVSAIGSQAHCNVSTTFNAMDQALTDLESLGLPIHITELDVNSAAAGQRGTGADIGSNAATTQGGLVAEADSRLAEAYAGLFRAFVKHKDAIDVVTFWGVNDEVSWRAQGRPLLFDGNNEPKPAFHAVVQVKAVK